VAFARWLQPPVHRERAERLYSQVVAQARRAEFYRDCGVPDTLDGRFDMILLISVLVLRRLRREGDDGGRVGQAYFDAMMDDMDRSLREMGVGDLSVGRRVKAMARAFYGRAKAYETALGADDDVPLRAALRGNLFATTEPGDGTLAAVAAYVRREAAALETQSGTSLVAGVVEFGLPWCVEEET
jgi:cytochrome b pre-mRNA-processing protein 3